MTSFRQIDANRRNAAKSTGPKTAQGKEQSRRNALRHGLTAETVIGSLEDAEDYKAFEEAIAADYDAQSAVERELVLRLAGLLWRLRRTTRIEAGLFALQATQLQELKTHDVTQRQIIHALLGQPAVLPDEHCQPPLAADQSEALPDQKRANAGPEDPADDLARCYLRLAHLPNCALDRLNRYEVALWRQVVQTLFALDALHRRKPRERRRDFGLFEPAWHDANNG
jgi:hypothetical protein